MASPSTVLSLGFGSWGGVNLLPTLGYGVGGAAVTPGPVSARWKAPAGPRAWAALAGARKWDVPAGRRAWEGKIVADLFAGVVPHKVGSTEDYEMDFGDCPQPSASPALTVTTQNLTASPVTSPALTIASVVAVGNYRVRGRFSGGLAGTDYTITGTITWSNGTTAVRTGTLRAE